MEKYARRALWTVVASKLARDGLSAFGAMFLQIGNGIIRESEALFLVECDAARRYKAATGYDLGGAAGYPSRYEDNPEQFAIEGKDSDEDMD